MQKAYQQDESLQLPEGAKIVVVQGEWHQEVTGAMVSACKEVLLDAGLSESNWELIRVPGALEIPLVAKLVAKKQPSAIVCFGAIVRGETYHFEMVANAVNEGMNKVAYDFEIPIIQQVLAVENLQQLKKRSSNDEFNKGIEAAQAVLKMLNLDL